METHSNMKLLITTEEMRVWWKNRMPKKSLVVHILTPFTVHAGFIYSDHDVRGLPGTRLILHLVSLQDLEDQDQNNLLKIN